MRNNSYFHKDILQGKTALVTGGASGIGLGIVHAFAQAGANVAIASRREKLCSEAAQDLSKQYNIRSIGRGLDVRDSSAVSKVFREVADELGSLDILINNAAGNFYFPSSKLRNKLWHTVIDTDLNGTFYCCREAFKYMKEKGGSIISTTMTLHHNGWTGMAHATAAKAGIDALTKTLAIEWGEFNIRVNAVAPGPIITEGVQKAFQLGTDFEEYAKFIPLKRSGKPEEVGNLMVYIASDASSWMTGSIITLDGGESLAKNRMLPGLDQIEAIIKSKKTS